MKRCWLAAGVALLLSACDEDPTSKLATAAPATGPALVRYSEKITNQLKLGANADLVQRFCKNLTGAACSTDIQGKLSAVGLNGQGTGVELASTFVRLEADLIDGMPDGQSSPENYLRAAYKVVLAREPDEGGAQVNLKFLKETGERGQVLRSMLQSEEFRGLS